MIAGKDVNASVNRANTASCASVQFNETYVCTAQAVSL